MTIVVNEGVDRRRPEEELEPEEETEVLGVLESSAVGECNSWGC